MGAENFLNQDTYCDNKNYYTEDTGTFI